MALSNSFIQQSGILGAKAIVEALQNSTVASSRVARKILLL
jgi:hypothetical protein